MKVGYLMTVFPHQGHLWFWREVCWMRTWGVPLHLFATRHPEERDRAEHAWAAKAESETTYLWPMGVGTILWVLLCNFLRAPIGFLKSLGLAFTIDIDFTLRPRWKCVIPLLVPACHLASLIRKHKITHLHTHTAAKGAIICMMIQRLTGVKWSLVVNAHLEWWGGGMVKKFSESDHTFFVTRWMIEQMQRDYSMIPRERYSLGRVGVDSRTWKPDSGPRSENPVPIILSVGRLVTSKNHNHCIQAIKILKDRGIPARLRIGGDGVERENLEQLIRTLDVGDRVEMLGSLSEDRYLEEMKRADVFCLASHGEPMGVVYMEAQAMEVPAVGCNALGAKELIVDGKTGLLVPPNSPADLAEAFLTLIRDPELRRRMGKAGRVHVLRNFDSRIWAANLYRYLMKSDPPDDRTPEERFAATAEEPLPALAEPVGAPA